MKKVLRNDGNFYVIELENGQYFINVHNKEGQEIDGFVIPFKTESEAYNAAQIAECAFRQGQQYVMNNK